MLEFRMVPLLKKIPQLPTFVWVVLSFLLAVFLYWPSLQGEPLWDDHFFIFKSPVVAGDFPYLKIWTDFAWPLSVSLEKLFYQVWQTNFLYYHLVNLVVHFLNSFLLLKIARRLGLPYPKLIFIFFLIHPANVISVSWMIQLKTLLCFTFAALSILCLQRTTETPRWYFPSWLLYFLSLISKSASIPLGLVLLFYGHKTRTKRDYLWSIPFLILMSLSTYQVLKSEVTSSGMAQVKDKNLLVVDETTRVKIPPAKQPPAPPKTEVAPKAATEVAAEEVFQPWQMILATSHYYFWQIPLPLEVHPVRGPVPSKNLFMGYGHLLVMVLILFLTWRGRAFWSLICGYVMLSPFLGILPAPYMNITWVSDQHLYLALPFFLFFWGDILSKGKLKFNLIFPILLIPYLCYQTIKAAGYYKNDIIFYTASLDASEMNLPITYNLVEAHLARGQIYDALDLTTEVVFMAQTDSKIRDSKYFPYIQKIHLEILQLQKP